MGRHAEGLWLGDIPGTKDEFIPGYPARASKRPMSIVGTLPFLHLPLADRYQVIVVSRRACDVR